MIGGWGIVRGAFRLRPNEEGLVGFAVGLVLENWAANLAAQVLPLPAASWVSAGLVFLAGMLLMGSNIKRRQDEKSGKALPLNFDDVKILFEGIKIEWLQWVGLGALTYLFIGIERGLAIFDDYAHLPTTSIMAAGNIPPQFPLDPTVSYGYHYFLMLFAAQVTRLGEQFPWVALDFSRGLSIALGVMLAGLWVQRLTHSSLAGFIGSLMEALGTGTRWLFLLFPASWLSAVSGSVQMIGSGIQTAPDLASALIKPWIIEGGGPYAFPFAYVNGLNSSGVMAHGPNGLIGAAITYPILLTFNRWRGWKGGVVSALLLASGMLLSESGVALGLAAWGLVALICLIQRRTWRLPRSLWQWLAVEASVVVIGFLQGGTWTDLFQGIVQQASGGEAAASYQTIGFQLAFPPTVVSSHLGVLSLASQLQLLTALIEIGPVLLVLPLVAVWGIKAYRHQRWYETVLILAGFISIPLLFVQFSGSAGVRNTSRLYSFINIASLFMVPVVWIWARHRSQRVKAVAAALGFVMIWGGVTLFGLEMVAFQKPVNSTFIKDLDAKMAEKYWNRLDSKMLVFDSNPFRATSVFGRYTNSSTTWLITKPAWEDLYRGPDPAALRAAGYGYVYIDYVYWYDVKPKYRTLYDSSCVKLVEEMKAKRGDDFRRLYDIRDCQ